MSGVVIEAKNRLDGRTYQASIVPKHQMIEYWLAPTLSPGDKEPQSAPVTLTATATARKSIFALRNPPPLLVVSYGIGHLEFDVFCALVLDILSTCDIQTLASEANRLAIDEICARYGLLADQGESRSSRSSKPIPIVMLFDRDAATRGY